MSQFASTAYSGGFSASGAGVDPNFDPFPVTASGSISATLSEDANDNVSGA